MVGKTERGVSKGIERGEEESGKGGKGKGGAKQKKGWEMERREKEPGRVDTKKVGNGENNF